ncbi:DUF4536 domain-containing protein [Mycena chlorophos]|uniref:DUF4536 domain-containing protein n=1 Tax=Mycena chlorophos TaxID=658473 RepID=A0A8H6TG86_MYCCL|nr:DUF4536 domain-containing protein [Mycena chlorophos]
MSTHPQQECLACRISGTATFTGLGLYALWQSRAAAPGGRASKRIIAVFGVAMLVGGVVRWRQTGAQAQQQAEERAGVPIPTR